MTSTESKKSKVDRAFEVVERLEKNEKKETAATASVSGEKKSPAKSGLQFCFSMDALISDQDTRTTKEEKLRAGESNLLNFKITLPHIWKVPVLGKAALKIVERIQREEYPESLKEILSSLRKKKG